MATIAPEGPGKSKAKLHIRRRVGGKSDGVKSAGPLRPSSSRNTGSAGQSVVKPKGNQDSSPESSMQPDFAGETASNDSDWQPEGWDADNSGYDDSDPTSKADDDDKDRSNAEENSPNEPQNDWAPPTGEAQDPNQSPDVAAAESNASPSDGQDTSGNLNSEGFANDPEKGSWANAVDQADRNKQIIKANRRKRKGVFGVIGGIGVTLAIVGAIISIPQLALNNALDKLTGALGSRTSFIVEQRFDQFVSKYISQSLVPSLDACGGVIERGCAVYNTRSNLLKRKFEIWNNKRLQDRLFKNHGVEFKLDRKNPSKKPDMYIHGKFIGAIDQNISVRQLREKIRLETKNDEVIKRRYLRSVGSIFGLQWCTSFKLSEGVCDVKNRVNDRKEKVGSALKRRKIQLAARIVSPAGARSAAFMLCLVEGCSPDKVATAGFEESKNLFKNADGDVFDDLVKKIGNRKISQVLAEEAAEKLLTNVFKGAASKISARGATSAIPIAGQVYLVAVILDIADRMDNFIKQGGISEFIYSRNSQASLAYTSTMISSIEESNSFDVPIEEQGATFQLLEGYPESRMYSKLIGKTPSNGLKCENEYVITKDSSELVCPELSLAQEVSLEKFRENKVVDTIVEAGLGPWRKCVLDLSVPGLGTFLDLIPGAPCPSVGATVRPVITVVDSTFGFLINIVFSVVKLIPGVSEATDFLTAQAGSVLASALNNFMPLSVIPDAVSWRAFDQMAGGFDFMYNQTLGGYEDESGQYQGFGAGEISPAAAAELDIAVAEWRNEKLESQNVFARYLDIGNYDSLATTSLVRLSSVLPFAGKPIDIGVSVSSMFSSVPTLFGGKASATFDGAAIYNKANFGTTQFAFTLSQLRTDIEDPTLSEENCELEKAAFREARENGDTSFSTLCMLDEAVVDIATKALDPDPDVGPSIGGGPSGIPEGLIKGTPLPGGNTTGTPCPETPTSSFIRVENQAYIQKVRYSINLCRVHGIEINSIVAKQYDDMLTAMAQAGFTVRGSNGFRSMAGQIAGWNGGKGSGTFAEPGTSNHQYGAAVDISCQGNGTEYKAGNGRGREAFLREVSKYPCLEWIAANSHNYGLLLMCIGEGSNGNAIRESAGGGGCEWWHISPTGG